jgi:hypothetical protein
MYAENIRFSVGYPIGPRLRQASTIPIVFGLGHYYPLWCVVPELN